MPWVKAWDQVWTLLFYEFTIFMPARAKTVACNKFYKSNVITFARKIQKRKIACKTAYKEKV